MEHVGIRRGFQSFLEHIVRDREPVDALLDALRWRGFLFDVENARLFLSVATNAHRYDAAALHSLFESIGLPMEHVRLQRNEFQVELKRLRGWCDQQADLTGAIGKILHWEPLITLDRQYPQDGYREWGAFAQLEHGLKVALDGRGLEGNWDDTTGLDAGIAYLVKALNAAGAATYLSCAGHEARQDGLPAHPDAWVSFIGLYHRACAKCYIDACAVRPSSDVTIRWEGETRRLVGPEFQRHFVALFLADSIYENRKALREVRRSGIDAFGEGQPTPKEFEDSLMSALETQTAPMPLKPTSRILSSLV